MRKNGKAMVASTITRCFSFLTNPIFLFAPSKTEERLRTVIFRAWNRLNVGKLVRQANQLKICRPALDYLVKEGRACRGKGKLSEGDSHWWGQRHGELLARYYTAPSKRTVAAEMVKIFPRVILPAGLRFIARMLAREKASVLETSLDKGDWE